MKKPSNTYGKNKLAKLKRRRVIASREIPFSIPVNTKLPVGNWNYATDKDFKGDSRGEERVQVRPADSDSFLGKIYAQNRERELTEEIVIDRLVKIISQETSSEATPAPQRRQYAKKKKLKSTTDQATEPVINPNQPAPISRSRYKDLSGYLSRIQKIAPTVGLILKNNLKTRDDDNLLLFEVWARQIANGFPVRTYRQFQKLLLDQKLTTPETITRARRKLQEKFPELRGELYAKRKRLEQAIRSELKKQMQFDFMGEK